LNCIKTPLGIKVILTDEEVIGFYKYVYPLHNGSIARKILGEIDSTYRFHGIDLRQRVCDSIEQIRNEKEIEIET
jgi:hypothetical protein